MLAVVLVDGEKLRHVPEQFRDNRAIVAAAVSSRPWALHFASDTLLQDDTFAVEARQSFYFFSVVTLSGRSCCVALEDLGYQDPRRIVLERACERLQMQRTGKELLLHGSETVPDHNDVQRWPGSPAPGRTVELQLVVQATSSGS
eukprot:361640-Amphidinium_carterae.1